MFFWGGGAQTSGVDEQVLRILKDNISRYMTTQVPGVVHANHYRLYVYTVRTPLGPGFGAPGRPKYTNFRCTYTIIHQKYPKILICKSISSRLWNPQVVSFLRRPNHFTSISSPPTPPDPDDLPAGNPWAETSCGTATPRSFTWPTGFQRRSVGSRRSA